MRSILLLALLLCVGCPQCSSAQDWRSVTVTQSYAHIEAHRLAAGGRSYYRAHGGHPGGNMPGARFTGTGYSSSPHNIRTCEPRTPMTLIADSVTRGIDGLYYRVRAWR
jgi:hypothetical protein